MSPKCLCSYDIIIMKSVTELTVVANRLLKEFSKKFSEQFEVA